MPRRSPARNAAPMRPDPAPAGRRHDPRIVPAVCLVPLDGDHVVGEVPAEAEFAGEDGCALFCAAGMVGQRDLVGQRCGGGGIHGGILRKIVHDIMPPKPLALSRRTSAEGERRHHALRLARPHRQHPSRTARTAGARSTKPMPPPCECSAWCRDSRARTALWRLRAEAWSRIDHVDGTVAGARSRRRSGVLDRVADQVAQRHRHCRLRRIHHQPRRPSGRSSSGLPPSWARWLSSNCCATFATSHSPTARSLRDSSSRALIRSAHCC